MTRYYMRFNDKCIELVPSSDHLIVKGKSSVEIRPRLLTANGVQHSEVHSIRGGKKKIVYVLLREMGINCPGSESIQDELSLGLAHVKHTKTGIGGYITIVTSGAFLIDYIVISDNEIAVILPGKREVFLDQVGDILTIYIV